MIDIAIIGCGPAGLSAAVNAHARNKNSVVFGNKINTSALFKSKRIDNHLGMFSESGEHMLNVFLEHANKLGIEIRNGRVIQILSRNNFFTVNFENEFIDAKTIIIAIGSVKSKKIPGQEKFLGSGVSYCATCDGMFYKNKSVVVIADNFQAESDVKFLSEICKNVIYLPKYNLQSSFSSNVEILFANPKEILGNDSVNAISIGEEKIPCAGVFILNEVVSPDKIIFGLEMDGPFIKVNRLCQTNLFGVFSAGDCTGWPLQLSKAIGDGQIAAQSASKFIDTLE